MEAREQNLLRSVLENTWRFYVWVGFLIVVLLWGLYAYIQQLRDGLIVTGMRDQISWGLYITNFVFFIGISHAGTLISAILRVTDTEWRTPITRMAEAITVFALCIGGPMVMIDMGRPDRMLNLFRLRPYPVAHRLGCAGREHLPDRLHPVFLYPHDSGLGVPGRATPARFLAPSPLQYACHRLDRNPAAEGFAGESHFFHGHLHHPAGGLRSHRGLVDLRHDPPPGMEQQHLWSLFCDRRHLLRNGRCDLLHVRAAARASTCRTMSKSCTSANLACSCWPSRSCTCTSTSMNT